jgi:hypothetical protein
MTAPFAYLHGESKINTLPHTPYLKILGEPREPF